MQLSKECYIGRQYTKTRIFSCTNMNMKSNIVFITGFNCCVFVSYHDCKIDKNPKAQQQSTIKEMYFLDQNNQFYGLGSIKIVFHATNNNGVEFKSFM